MTCSSVQVYCASYSSCRYVATIELHNMPPAGLKWQLSDSKWHATFFAKANCKIIMSTALIAMILFTFRNNSTEFQINLNLEETVCTHGR